MRNNGLIPSIFMSTKKELLPDKTTIAQVASVKKETDLIQKSMFSSSKEPVNYFSDYLKFYF